MKLLLTHLTKVSATTAIAVFAVAFFCLGDYSMGGLASSASYGVTAGALIAVMYERALWKANPFEKRPRISGSYDCVLEYSHERGRGKKETIATVRQTLLTTSVSFSTDEITSNTKAAELVEESGRYVLYYTYLTTPKARCSVQNPIQYGTCRLEVMDGGILAGTYWTSRATIGDIVLAPRKKQVSN